MSVGSINLTLIYEPLGCAQTYNYFVKTLVMRRLWALRQLRWWWWAIAHTEIDVRCLEHCLLISGMHESMKKAPSSSPCFRIGRSFLFRGLRQYLENEGRNIFITIVRTHTVLFMMIMGITHRMRALNLGMPDDDRLRNEHYEFFPIGQLHIEMQHGK